MEELPVDLFIQQITYLPFDDVTNLCQTNKKFHEYCTNTRYENNWRSLIQNTFSQIDDYQDNLDLLLKKYNGYNYHVYTNFITLLDPITQGMIYYKQGDMKSFEKLTRKQKFIAMFFLGNKKVARNYLNQGYSKYFNLMDGNYLKSDLDDILKDMIDENSLSGFKYVVKKGATISGFIFSQIIKQGRLKMLKYLVDIGTEINKLFLLTLAGYNDKTDIINYLQSLPN